jgi:hypothetical protein
MELTKAKLIEIINEEIQKTVAEDENKEGSLARSQLYKIAKNAQSIHDIIGDYTNLPEWAEAKITRAADSLGAVKDHIEYEIAKGDM